MMTAHFRLVLALAFRPTRRHIRRRMISYWGSWGRACGLGVDQSMRGGLELALALVSQMVSLPQSQLVTLVSQMVLLPRSTMMLWPVKVIWRFLMMTARGPASVQCRLSDTPSTSSGGARFLVSSFTDAGWGGRVAWG
jgi:hypothetical protein